MFRIGVIFVVLLFVIVGTIAMTSEASAKGAMENLGMTLYTDAQLSLHANQACQSCHHRTAGFADPQNRRNPVNFPVSQGSDVTKFGGRNAPTAAYAAFSPKLHFDGVMFLGGLFWDGRASGLSTTGTGGLGAGPTLDPLADQAKGPFLNPVEHGLQNETAVVSIVQSNSYLNSLFKTVFGPNAFADVPTAYNNIAKAIAAFERDSQVNKFKSRFDKFVTEQGGDVSTFGVTVVTLPDGTPFRQYVGPPPGFSSQYFTYAQADGLALFNADSYTQLLVSPAGGPNGGMCYLCHLTQNHVADNFSMLPPGTVYPPQLTDFSYDNLGMGVNPRIAALAGPQNTDYGLGDISRVPELLTLHPGLNVVGGYAVDEIGKFKVPSLRNCAATAPYGHNGLFPDLYSIVHFYNTRDNPWPGESFPVPEVPSTVNSTELGNLGLTFDQEMNMVKFLETLTDMQSVPAPIYRLLLN